MLEIRRSEVELFLSCKRSFWLTYVLGVEKNYPEEGRPAQKYDIGSMWHMLLAHYYRGRWPEGDDPAHEELHGMCTMWAMENGAVNSAGEYGDNWPSFIDYAVSMFIAYRQHAISTRLDEDYEILHIEDRIHWDLKIGGYPVRLTGEPDIVKRDNVTGLVIIDDHKSVQNLDKQAPRSGNFQGLTYGVLVKKALGYEADEFVHNQAKRLKAYNRAKPPYFGRAAIQLDAKVLAIHEERLKRILTDIVKFILKVPGIDTEDHWYEAMPNANGECSWKCRVYELCEAMDFGENWRRMATEVKPGRFHYTSTPVVLTKKGQ